VNRFFGGAGNDTIAPGNNDTVSAGDGDDLVHSGHSIDGGNGHDTITAGFLGDTVTGGAGNDLVDGSAGDDLILEGDGFDTIVGGDGNDTVSYAASATAIIAIQNEFGEGIVTDGTSEDQLFGVEGMILSTLDDEYYGGDLGTTVSGGGGNDWLEGEGGNDLFLVDASGIDTVLGGSGNDTVRAEAAGARVFLGDGQVENFDGAGFADFRIVGSADGDVLDFTGVTMTGVARIDGGLGHDTIIGTSGADTLAGSAGNDSLSGGDGDDIFLVDLNGQSDTILGGNGYDVVRADANSVRISLFNLSGVEEINANGRSSVVVQGTSGADVMDLSTVLLVGVTFIDGGLGDDVMLGTSVRQNFIGSAGADTLTGNGGNDLFTFPTTSHSTAAAPDHITDFNSGDIMVLSGIDANSLVAGNQAFTWIGSGSFTGVAGQLRFEIGGGVTTVYGDVNGDTVADLVIVLDNAFNLGTGGAANFVL